MKVKNETIVRTIVLAVTLFNTVLTALGKNPLPWSESEIYGGISAVAGAVAAVWSWWKNNSFTQSALEADEYKASLKEARKSENN